MNEEERIPENKQIPSNPEIIGEEKQANVEIINEHGDSSKAERKKKKIRNLKIGDIIYFNYQADIHLSDNQQAKGVIVGDGIASDQLHCMPRDILCKSNAQLNFRKTLFEIENIQESIEENNNKEDIEPEPEYLQEVSAKGQQVTYGMFIQLRHIYSNCLLTLKREHLAEQNGCVKITLEEQSSQESHFRFMAANSLQLSGQFIQYTDKIVLGGLDTSQYLQISQEGSDGPANANHFMNGLEVNASEDGTPLKVSSYIDYLERQSRISIAQKYLRNGDLVYLRNTHLEACLAVQYPSLATHTHTQSTIYNQQSFNQSHVQMSSLYSQQTNLSIMVEQNIKSDRLQINALWEIQQSQVFDGSLPKDTDYFKIKNLSTGLLLCSTKSGGLILTADSSNRLTRFQLKLKKHASVNDSKVPYQTSLIIRNTQGQLLTVIGNTVQCTQKNTNYASFTFELRPVEARLQNIGDRICSLYPQLLSFLDFLQQYGMNKETIDGVTHIIYENRQRQDRQRALESEVLQLFQSLQNLEDFLQRSQCQTDERKAYKLKQYSLQDMQILDLLLQIAKSIDSLRYLDYYQQSNSTVKQTMERPAIPAILTCHPLNQAQTQIYQMIEKIVQGNRKISEYVIQQGHFCFLLSQYTQLNSSIIQGIMKEVTHNAYQTAMVQLQHYTDYILPMSQMTTRSAQYSQIFALDIISQMMIHRQKTPQKDRQLQIRKWLFKNKYPQGLLVFSLHGPAIQFNLSQEPLDEQFYVVNPSLQNLKREGNLIMLSEFTDQKKNLQIYVNYIASYIGLMANMCAGRNEKGINLIQKFGLSAQLIMSVLDDVNGISIVIKNSFRMLFMNTYLNLNPMKWLTNFSNKNIIYTDIIEFDPNSPSYKLIGVQFFDQLNQHQKVILSNYNAHKNSFMKSWLQELVDIKLKDVIVEQDQQYIYNSDSSLLIRKKLQAFIGFLQFSKQVINLGYTSRNQNKKIIEKIEEFFQAKSKDKNLSIDQKNNWIYSFFSNLSELLPNKNCIQEQKLVRIIYTELLEIIYVCDKISILIEQDQFLYNMKIDNQGYKNFLIKNSQSFQAKQLRRNLFEMIIDPSNYQSKKNFDVVMTPRLSKIIYKMINQYCDKNDILSKELLNVVLINNQSEIDFFKAFGGFIVRENSEEEDESIIINPMFFKKQISKLKEENIKLHNSKIQQMDENKIQKLDQKRLKTISVIDTILQRSIAEIMNIKSDIFQTGQQILKNFCLEDVVVEILQIQHYDKSYKDLFNNVIKFLEYFSQDNYENQQQLNMHFETLIQVVHYNISIRKLFSIMLDNMKESSNIGKYINTITQKLEENATKQNNFQCDELLSILLSLTKNKYKSTIRSNQHLILVKILEIEELKNFLQNSSYYEYTKGLIETSTQEAQIRKKENNQLDIANLMRLSSEIKESKWHQKLICHLNTVRLLSSCAADYSLGVQSVRQVISQKALHQLFFDDNPTHFTIKMPYLRLYFNVFVSQESSDFKLQDMVKVFKKIILNDLKQFVQYLEGVISIEYEQEVQVEEAQKSRLKIKSVINKRGQDQKNVRQSSQKMNTTSQFSDNTSLSFPKTKIIHDPNEYWEYLIGGQVYDNTKDGLLHFVVDCLQEINRRKWLITDKENELAQLLRQLKAEAEKIQNSIKRIEQQEGLQTFTSLNLLIKALISLVPEIQVQRAGYTVCLQNNEFMAESDDMLEDIQIDSEQQTKEKDDILHYIRNHILANRITTQDFFNMFRYDNMTIDAGKYLDHLNALLDLPFQLTDQQLMAHLALLNIGFLQDGRQCIHFRAMLDQVTMLFEHNQLDNRLLDEIKHEMTIINTTSKLDKESKSQDLVLERNKLCYLQSTSGHNQCDQQISQLLYGLHNSYGQVNKHEFFKCFINKFGGHTQILYLLKIIRRSLEHDLNKNHKDLSKVQLAYHKSNTTQLVLSLINENNEEMIVYESILILNSLLEGGNLQIQEDILLMLKKNEKEIKFGLFSFLKSTISRFKISMTKSKEKQQIIYSPQQFYEQKQKVSSQVMIKQVLFLLQLLCENCNNNLQNYLSLQIQDDAKDDLTCINIVKETADLLSCLTFNKEIQKCIFTKASIETDRLEQFRPDEGLLLNISDGNQLRIEFNVIVDQCFQTLTDFCVGPCGNNQQLLCDDLKLIQYINENILRQEHKFNLDQLDNEINQSHIDVLSSCIKYLLIITIGNQNQSILITLIDRLEVRRLMEKMKDIYQNTIKVREEQIVSKKKFDFKGSKYPFLWKRDSAKFNENINDFNEWYYERQNQRFNKIIKLGFNIFILFQFFIDVKDNSDHRFENLKGQQSTIYNKYVIARKKDERSEEIKKIQQDQKAQKLQIIKLQQEEFNTDKNEYQGRNDLSMEDLNESMKFIKKDNKSKSNKKQMEKESNAEIDALQEKVDKQIEKVNLTFQDFQQQMDEHEKYAICCNFYKVLVGSVEIAKDSKDNGTKQLFKLYFPKEYLSKFITEHIRTSIIRDVSFQSDQDRIRQFFEQADNYCAQMVYRQKLSRLPPVFYFFIKNYRIFKDISFYFIICINIWLIASLQKSSDNTITTDGNYNNNIYHIDSFATLVGIFSVIQVLLSFIVYAGCLTSKYKLSLNVSFRDDTAVQKQIIKNRIQPDSNSQSLFSRINIFIFSNDSAQQGQFSQALQKILKVFFFHENIYNLIYLIISLTSYFQVIFYSFLLLDIVKRSQDLQNIFKSLTLNSSSLAKTFFLFLIIVYLFSIYGFLYLSDYYVEDSENASNYANSLLQAFISTFNNGLRNGGGIGDTLKQPQITSPDYWTMWVFQLLFFIMVNILFINIIFGIIIDTFGQLRDQRQEMVKKIQEQCYICGLNRYEFENKGKGWLQHIYLEHNLYNYLHFIIYIRNMESQECNGLEKYVKDLIAKNNHSFIPIEQAICLEESP